MVKKVFVKNTLRIFTSNFSRFISVLLIVFVGIAFVTGLGTLAELMTDSIQQYFKDNNGADIILKTSSPFGFTASRIEEIKNNEYVEDIKKVTSFDSDGSRIFFINGNDEGIEGDINKLTLTDGKYPSSEDEILIDRICQDVKIGDKINVSGKEYTVSGIVENPLYITKDEEPDLGGEPLKYICYADRTLMGVPEITTDLYIRVKFEDNPDIYSDSYSEYIETVCDSLTDEQTFALTLNENLTHEYTKSLNKKITAVAAVFPAFFVIVSCLVVYSTLSRLIEEERSLMGCYRSLGISKFAVIIRYLLFSFFGCLFGTVIGIAVGVTLFPAVIYPAFDATFFMPEMTSYRNFVPGLIASVLTIAFITFITVFIAMKTLKTAPCNLLHPKSPKAGRKIIFERITFIWKRLPFRIKSSVRNICRYIAHTVMTVISVMGSTALVYAGFGLYSISNNPDTEKIPVSMAGSFAIIASIIIIFAVALSVLIVFNLTNMNIQERKREIATLRVLGYQNPEVGLYIYREVLMTSVVGVILGLPLGYVFLQFFFEYLEFGRVGDIEWYWYAFTALLVAIAVITVSILLYPKIKKIDMNSSLKNVD